MPDNSPSAIIRGALPSDAVSASRIALAAKAHWGYSPAVMALWEPQLSISPEYIAAHSVLVAELDGAAVGVCAVEERGTHRELAHLWVLPGAQGQGIGSALLREVLTMSAGRPGPLRVESDPNAASFYVRAGGVRVGAIAAPIPAEPERTLAVFVFMAHDSHEMPTRRG